MDLSEALNGLKVAAEAGYVDANTELGACHEGEYEYDDNENDTTASLYYLSGGQSLCWWYCRGVKKNEKEAKRLLQLSADQGYIGMDPFNEIINYSCNAKYVDVVYDYM